MSQRMSVALVVLALWTSAALAQDSLPPEAALAKLKLGNKRFYNDKLALRNLDSARRKELLAGQKPFAIVVTCSDARVAPELLFDQGLGEILVLRVSGNIASPDIVASIEEALQKTPARLIVMMGHDQCSTVREAMKPAGENESKNLSWLYKQIDPGKNLPKEPKDALPIAIKTNVMRQAQLLSENSEVIRQSVLTDRVRIVPAIYELATGKVDWLETTKATGKQVALIRVFVPTPDAKVWLDGMETKSRGLERVFEVPPVDVDREYSYEIRAEWLDVVGAARTVAIDKKTVRFKGGTTVTVKFGSTK